MTSTDESQRRNSESSLTALETSENIVRAGADAESHDVVTIDPGRRVERKDIGSIVPVQPRPSVTVMIPTLNEAGNRWGGWVASQSGAMPALPDSVRNAISAAIERATE